MASTKQIVSVVLIVVGLVVAISLTPTIQEVVTSVTGTGSNNLTGSAATLMGQVPLFYVIVVMAIAIAGIRDVLS